MRRFRIKRISVKLIGATLVLLALVWLGFSLYIINSEKAVLSEQIDAQGTSLARASAIFCIEPLVAGDYPSLDTYSQAMVSEKDNVECFRILRVDGKVLSEYPRGWTEEDFKKKASCRFYASPVTLPLQEGETTQLGSVVLGISTRRSGAVIRSRTRSLILQTSFSFLVSGGLLFFLLKKTVTDPLRKLDHHAKALGQGDLDTPIVLEADDEFGRLSITLDRMRLNLNVSRSELLQAKNELEERVEERTAELHEANEQLKKEMSERKKAEEQVRRAQKMQAIGTLAGGVAHDFNNILAIMLGNTELAMADLPEQTRARNDLGKVVKAGKRARDIVQQILTFSRQGEQERRPTLLRPIVHEAIALLQTAVPVTITVRQNVNIAGDRIMADPTQILQVIMNLCTNAYQAIGERGGEMEISVNRIEVDGDLLSTYTNLRKGTYLRVSVRDTGDGMSQATRERLFEPFFTTKPVGEGTGLGLSVVHGIVMSHGGDIGVHSEPGKGTTFHVFLPRLEGKPGQETQQDQSIPRGDERILVVDDEEEVASVAKRLLEDLGYDVTHHTSSQEALDLFRATPGHFDLVITDYMMPNLSGIELAQALLRVRSDLPMVLYTGYGMAVTPEECKQRGIREYLKKPVDTLELGLAVRRALDQERRNESHHAIYTHRG